MQKIIKIKSSYRARKQPYIICFQLGLLPFRKHAKGENCFSGGSFNFLEEKTEDICIFQDFILIDFLATKRHVQKHFLSQPNHSTNRCSTFPKKPFCNRGRRVLSNYSAPRASTQHLLYVASKSSNYLAGIHQNIIKTILKKVHQKHSCKKFITAPSPTFSKNLNKSSSKPL